MDISHLFWSWDLKVHFISVHKDQPLDHILCTVHILAPFFFKVHLNIVPTYAYDLELIFSLEVFQIIYFIPYEKIQRFLRKNKGGCGKKDVIGPRTEVIT